VLFSIHLALSCLYTFPPWHDRSVTRCIVSNRFGCTQADLYQQHSKQNWRWLFFVKSFGILYEHPFYKKRVRRFPM